MIIGLLEKQTSADHNTNILTSKMAVAILSGPRCLNVIIRQYINIHSLFYHSSHRWLKWGSVGVGYGVCVCVVGVVCVWVGGSFILQIFFDLVRHFIKVVPFMQSSWHSSYFLVCSFLTIPISLVKTHYVPSGSSFNDLVECCWCLPSITLNYLLATNLIDWIISINSIWSWLGLWYQVIGTDNCYRLTYHQLSLKCTTV